jgi:putative membrane protein insertion efficiency factor
MRKWPSSSREPSSSPRTASVGRAVGRALIGLVQAYRVLLAPLLAPTCRFAPSCSAFAVGALRVHGPWVGTKLALARVARCHPWNPGGFDPVPSAD